MTEEEIRLLVSESHEQGVIDDDERNMMNRVLRLGDRSTASLMTPRTRIAWLDAAGDFDENLAAMRETPFSRYPVYRGSDADVVGILEIKSLIDRLDAREFDLFKYLREPLFLSESAAALKALEIVREEQHSLALVVDEYGDVTGLVTVNDIMEAVIGRTRKTQDGGEATPLVVVRDDGSLLVDGSLSTDNLRELLGGADLAGEDEHEFPTAAGMTTAHFGRIPNVGEHFDWNDWRIEVVDLDGRAWTSCCCIASPGTSTAMTADDDPRRDTGQAGSPGHARCSMRSPMAIRGRPQARGHPRRGSAGRCSACCCSSPRCRPSSPSPASAAPSGGPLTVLVGVHLLVGMRRLCLPRFIARRGPRRASLQAFDRMLAPWLARLERLVKPRMTALIEHRAAAVFTGLLLVLLGILLALPIRSPTTCSACCCSPVRSPCWNAMVR